jgi:large subunit ribosomal protein L23
MRMILVKPVITEKATKMADKRNVYSFVVDKTANKIEIRKAVETMFNVSVEAVNTCIVPAKAKSRSTKKSVTKGFRAAYKKAFVTLPQGETIDIYGAPEEEEVQA